MPVIPATWEVKIGEIQFEAIPGKILANSISMKSQMWWFTPVEGSRSESGLAKNARTYLKNN
jgi:hypothetical protein